ncbi:MAG: hypothetical protein JWR54_2269 [Mucilaginibacter sp.]|nr:hypothetical protein [Mucilaginibacter sp.]
MYTFIANGKSYYLTVYLIIASSKDVGEGIHICNIDNGQLTDAKLIKTHSACIVIYLMIMISAQSLISIMRRDQESILIIIQILFTCPWLMTIIK